MQRGTKRIAFAVLTVALVAIGATAISSPSSQAEGSRQWPIRVAGTWLGGRWEAFLEVADDDTITGELRLPDYPAVGLLALKGTRRKTAFDVAIYKGLVRVAEYHGGFDLAGQLVGDYAVRSGDFAGRHDRIAARVDRLTSLVSNPDTDPAIGGE